VYGGARRSLRLWSPYKTLFGAVDGKPKQETPAFRRGEMSTETTRIGLPLEKL
jgi:hypothetical protein